MIWIHIITATSPRARAVTPAVPPDVHPSMPPAIFPVVLHCALCFPLCISAAAAAAAAAAAVWGNFRSHVISDHASGAIIVSRMMIA